MVFRGHAIECRINAEHPERFTPSAGKITAFNMPGGTGIRVDTAAYAEGVIPPYYDSLIAKLVVRGRDRTEAISRMSRALEMFVVEGIHTTIPLHQRIMRDPDFRAGNFDTKFMERFWRSIRRSPRDTRYRFFATENQRARRKLEKLELLMLLIAMAALVLTGTCQPKYVEELLVKKA